MPSGPKKRRAAAKKKEHESKIEPNKSPNRSELTTDFSSSPSGDSGKFLGGNEVAEQSSKEYLMKSVPLMDVNSSVIEKQTEIVSEDDVSVNKKASLKEKVMESATKAEESSVTEAFVDCLKENEKGEAAVDLLEDRIVEENEEDNVGKQENYVKENAQVVADRVGYDYIKEDIEANFSVKQIKNLTSFGIEICGNMAEQIKGLRKKTEEDYDVLLKAIAHSMKVLESINAMQA